MTGADRATATIVIQARMGSSRLPGKVLAPVADGRPLLAVLVERLRPTGLPVWIATTQDRQDDVTAAWADELGVGLLRGPTLDVLARYVAVARHLDTPWIVRVTADDPCTDAATVTAMVAAATGAADDVDVVCEVGEQRRFPLGFTPQVARTAALVRLDTTLPPEVAHHRSHVTSALIPDRALAFVDASAPARPDWRWTVDTPDDLAMVRRLFAGVGPAWATATYRDLVAVADGDPSIPAMNAHVAQRPLEEG